MSQEQFSRHEEPAWRDRANFIINAPLPEAGRYEQLWCRQLGDNTFEVCCIPFFLYDVALGDTVKTSPKAGRTYVLDHVVERSGRFVFRVYFAAEMVENREEVAARLIALGGALEWSSPRLVAVDAQDDAHAQAIADYLFGQEETGRLMYETGRTA